MTQKGRRNGLLARPEGHSSGKQERPLGIGRTRVLSYLRCEGVRRGSQSLFALCSMYASMAPENAAIPAHPIAAVTGPPFKPNMPPVTQPAMTAF